MISDFQYDGFLELEIKSDGIYIVVHAPSEEGKAITLEEGKEFLKSKCLEDYDLEALSYAVLSKNEKEVRKISNATQLPAVDEKIVIEISKNKMFAVVSFKEPQNEGKILSKDEIIKALNAEGIVYGIDYETIDKILVDKKYEFKYLIARGLAAVNGVNGRLEFHFDVEKKNIKPKISEDGSIDFKNLDLIEMVKQGDKLVTLIPPEEGTVGKNIFGTEILNIKGKNAVLPKGKNVRVSEDGSILLADIDGQITFLEGKVNIYSSYQVPANVDNSTGNIDFIGNVVIKGNVLTGFSVKAGGNIEVHGVVEGADLEAGGNIILYRGMQGMNRGTLRCKGDVTAKYIENSVVIAKGNIQASAIMHSEVKSGGSIMLEGKKGLLVGGIVRAAKEIVVKTLGSPMATVTEIEVGIDPEIIERYKELKDSVEKVKVEIENMGKIVDNLTQVKKSGKISPEKEQMLLKSMKSKIFLQNKMQNVQNELNQIEPKIQDRADGRIKVANVVYPGVKVTIGTTFTYIREERKFCSMYSEHAEIKFGSYS